MRSTGCSPIRLMIEKEESKERTTAKEKETFRQRTKQQNKQRKEGRKKESTKEIVVIHASILPPSVLYSRLIGQLFHHFVSPFIESLLLSMARGADNKPLHPTWQFFHHLHFCSCALLNRLDGFAPFANNLRMRRVSKEEEAKERRMESGREGWMEEGRNEG